MSKSLSFYNLTGGLNTVQDLATINSTTNRTETPDMMNIEYHKLGGIRTMKGNKQLGNITNLNSGIPDALKDIVCGIEYIVGNESYLVVANKAGDVFEYNPETKQFVALEDHFTYQEEGEDFSNTRVYAVAYNNGIVMVNGREALYYNRTKDAGSQVQVWTPTLQTQNGNDVYITTFKPVAIASYRGRLFMGANEATQTLGDEEQTYEGGMLFYSGVGLGTQETWEESSNTGEDAGAFLEFFEDSSNFTGLGTWAEYLVVHKEQNTYLLNGTGDLAEEWELKPYSEYTVPSQQSYVVANNGYYTYVTEAGGIYPLLTRSIYNNTYQGGDLSTKIKDSFDLIDTANYDKIYAVYHPKKKYLMFYIPTLNSNGSNQCYIYDIQTKTWLFRRVPQYVTCTFKFENEVYIGVKYVDDEGISTVKILREFSGKTFDGTPIDFHYLTPSFIWGGGTNKTTTKEFRVKLVSSSANHFYLESLKDGLMDTKEQRLVKNVNDNLDGLIWDIGINEADKLYDDSYVTTTFYKYVDSEGNEYFAKDYPLEDTTMIYGDTEEVTIGEDTYYILTEPKNYYKYFSLNTLIEVTAQDNPDVTETIYNTSYAWNRQNKTLQCYKNGDWLAWIDTQTGVCTTNIIDQTSTTTQYYAFYGVDYNRNLNGNLVATSAEYVSLVEVGIPLPNIPFWWWNGSSWTNTVQYGTQTLNIASTNLLAYGTTGTGGYGVAGIYNGYPFVPLSYSVDQYRSLKLYRAQEYDGVTTTITEVPSGNNPTGKTKTYTTGSGTITISVNGTNLTLSRYEAGDRGSAISDSNVYSKEETGTVTIYSDSTCSTSLTTVTISDNSFTYSGNVYYRYSQADGNYDTYKYYKYSTLTYDSDIDGAELIYNYPEADDRTLTDTVWDYTDVDKQTDYFIIDRGTLTDQQIKENERLGYTYEDLSISNGIRGDAWLQQGYQTKRMLLPNQYFETVQFRFSGGGYDKDGNPRYNDSICISGFEVEGIQLAETPWN